MKYNACCLSWLKSVCSQKIPCSSAGQRKPKQRGTQATKFWTASSLASPDLLSTYSKALADVAGLLYSYRTYFSPALTLSRPEDPSSEPLFLVRDPSAARCC
jgi:hypothetical protein